MRRLKLLVCVLSLIVMLGTAFAASAQAGYLVHIVAPGENLSRIAVRYGTTVAAIASVNNIYNINRIYAGQTLYIPYGGYTPPPAPVPAPLPPGYSTYVVRPGDTLRRIAEIYNTTWYAIAQANNIANPNIIYAGQVLRIPPPQPVRIAVYYVMPGDTLRNIAARYGSSVGIIASYNGLYNPNLIYPGQVLYIPY